MVWNIFNTLVSPAQGIQLDQNYNQAMTGTSQPCTASGTNAISLTPIAPFPAQPAYTEFAGYRFVAVASSTALVTAQYNGLGFIPVYHQDGATQCTLGDIVINRQYIVTFHQALNSGSGGFFLEDPSQPVAGGGGGGGTGQTTPGGRLTLVNSSPVMFSNQTGIQNIFYVPYVHPFIPLYNGTNVQMYNFTPSLSATTGLTLALGGAANFPSGAAFDLYGFLVSGNPTLVAVQWTNTTTRATTLAVFGGYLTNAGAATAQTGANTSTTLPINQGTFLGSFLCSAQGACQWVFAGSASGGTAGAFNLANYYNTVLFNSICTDSGASYSYNSTTIRQARASAGNQIAIFSTSSERAISATFFACINGNAVNTSASAAGGVGLNTTTAFNAFVENFPTTGATTGTQISQMGGTYNFTTTGLVTVSRNEKADTTSGYSLDTNSADSLGIAAWL